MAINFNVVRFLVESNRGGKLTYSMRRLFKIIEDLS